MSWHGFTPLHGYSAPGGGPPPLPEQLMVALSSVVSNYDRMSDLDVMRFCLGLRSLPNMPAVAVELAKHIRVISIDTEHWSNDTRQMTEVGMANFNVLDMHHTSPAEYGSHGENLMRHIKFFLFRIIENAHLPNLNKNSKGVEGNRFGHHRFVTFTEMHNILSDLFNTPIKGVPSLSGLNHPVIVLGHAIGHDQHNLKIKQLAFDLAKQPNVIRYIDTQQMVRDSQFWNATNNNMGLNPLCGSFQFKHKHPHTACNDIADTVICAVQIPLSKDDVAKRGCIEPLQQVVWNLQKFSRQTFNSIGGSANYCWRCGSREHKLDDCRAQGSGPDGPLYCRVCANQNKPTDHIPQHCLTVAFAMADQKRKIDRQAKIEKSKGKLGNKGGVKSRHQNRRS